VSGPVRVSDVDLLRDVEGFLFLEARLMDEHRYAEWESLWTDDGVYWVPCGPSDDYDPELNVSIIYDDRDLIAARVRRLDGRYNFAQDPRSTLVRVVSNVELESPGDGDLRARSTFVLHEARRDDVRVWAGRNIHHLRVRESGDLQMSYKKVALVNRYQGLPNASFLL
jgi:3-phenylpropionate/cinnamic acid dioxygenase small subunit